MLDVVLKELHPNRLVHAGYYAEINTNVLAQSLPLQLSSSIRPRSLSDLASKLDPSGRSSQES